MFRPSLFHRHFCNMINRNVTLNLVNRCSSVSDPSSKLKCIISERFLETIEGKTSHNVLQQAQKLLKDMRELSDLKSLSSGEFLKDIEEEETELNVKMNEIALEIAEELSRDGDEIIATVLLEVNAGVGGQEAMLFAREVLTIYVKLCNAKGWAMDVIEEIDTELGGLQKSAIQIEGKHCYKLLRHEAGVHRVQRVPKTEKGGRVHTSTITVTVLPIKSSDENEEIPSKDLKIASVRSGGPGGQFVNKTETCIQILHLPTGIRVECQEGRNQMANKLTAMKKLRQLLWLRNREKILEEYERTKKNQVFSADRSEKIRTYNFPQDRITDHRLAQNMNNIKSFMAGFEGLQTLIDDLERRHKIKVFQQMLDE